MVLTNFQLAVCRLIAQRRVRGGESYVAGGAALGALTGSPRISRDLDLFHDSSQAVAASWDADRVILVADGCEVRTLRERPGFVEAEVSRTGERVVLQWAADSAFRFFPLVEHPDFGLVLHPFDLATNKVLALVGRVEARDWVDTIHCHDRIQPLGYLAWAACGKDPGFSPTGILEEASRTARYTHEEVRALDFDGPAPDAAELSRRWHAMLDEARRIVAVLPAESAGACVLGADGAVYRGDPRALAVAVAAGTLRFHQGSIRGALPRIV